MSDAVLWWIEGISKLLVFVSFWFVSAELIGLERLRSILKGSTVSISLLTWFVAGTILFGLVAREGKEYRQARIADKKWRDEDLKRQAEADLEREAEIEAIMRGFTPDTSDGKASKAVQKIKEDRERLIAAMAMAAQRMQEEEERNSPGLRFGRRMNRFLYQEVPQFFSGDPSAELTVLPALVPVLGLAVGVFGGALLATLVFTVLHAMLVGDVRDRKWPRRLFAVGVCFFTVGSLMDFVRWGLGH